MAWEEFFRAAFIGLMVTGIPAVWVWLVRRRARQAETVFEHDQQSVTFRVKRWWIGLFVLVFGGLAAPGVIGLVAGIRQPSVGLMLFDGSWIVLCGSATLYGFLYCLKTRLIFNQDRILKKGCFKTDSVRYEHIDETEEANGYLYLKCRGHTRLKIYLAAYQDAHQIVKALSEKGVISSA